MALNQDEEKRREMEQIIARYARRNELPDTPVPGLRVNHLTAPAPATTFLYEPSLCMCIRGKKQMIVGEARFTQDEDMFLLFSADMPAIVTIDSASPKTPYSALLLQLDLDVARQMMAEIDLNPLDAPPREESCMVYGRTNAELFDAILRLVRLIERPQESQIMSGLIQREILFRLLTGDSGSRLRQIVRLGSASQRVTKAIDWLRTHYTNPFSADQLADLAGMSASTLHRHFQEVTTMSPLQYQKHLRLHEARRLMLIDGLDAGTAAYRVGYESATQFNREYRRLFGAPPLRDVKTLRIREPAAIS